MRRRPQTRAQQRAAGTKKTALFDIVNAATANGSSASREAARPALVSQASAARHRSRACPRSAVRRRKSGKPDLRGPRGDTTDRSRHPYCATRVVALDPGSRFVRLRLSALDRDTRAGCSRSWRYILAKRTYVAESQHSCRRPWRGGHALQRHGCTRKAERWRYALRCSGTLPPVSASLIITCRCSQIFISAEPSSAPV